jgi:hypothetical protein
MNGLFLDLSDDILDERPQSFSFTGRKVVRSCSWFMIVYDSFFLTYALQASGSTADIYEVPDFNPLMPLGPPTECAGMWGSRSACELGSSSRRKCAVKVVHRHHSISSSREIEMVSER